MVGNLTLTAGKSSGGSGPISESTDLAWPCGLEESL